MRRFIPFKNRLIDDKISNVCNILSRNKSVTLFTLSKGFVLFRCKVGCLFEWLPFKMFVWKNIFHGIKVNFTNDEFRYENKRTNKKQTNKQTKNSPHRGRNFRTPFLKNTIFPCTGAEKTFKPFVIATVNWG